MKRFSLSILTLCLVSALWAQSQKLPLIGISGTHATGGATQVSSTYIQAVIRAGGVPVVLPINDNIEVLTKMVTSIDALIMTGGEDIDPLKYYNEEALPAQGEIDPERDAFDIALIKLAIERGIPLLGICRGHQLINVACGGTLYQDIPSQIKTGVIKHRQQAPGWYGTHRIELDPNSVLAKILGTTTIISNTFHHQAVKDVAPGFKVTGRTSDGVVETMEMKDNPRVFSVQFHPEAPTSRGLDDFFPIFTYLIGLASEQ
ncbi:MAG: gamma-glutamyl-gamma-aminobutyrate hydrolase family protein [Prevotellaceae bacterium]|jgi:putative glutamine amidotransferase|nr:gamma-glutamyl-gamma-aminobutyrate hydrolase family protein [Prevotellaceae bacterium]